MNTAPPKGLGAEVVKNLPLLGRKNRLNFWFRPENPSPFQWRPFFFRNYLFLGGKTASIWFKSNENLGQGRLQLSQPSQKAPLSEILATRLFVRISLLKLRLIKLASTSNSTLELFTLPLKRKNKIARRKKSLCATVKKDNKISPRLQTCVTSFSCTVLSLFTQLHFFFKGTSNF